MSNNLIARLAVAAVAIPAILWVTYQGGEWLFGMLLLFALIGCGEFLLGEKYRLSQPFFWLVLIFIAVFFMVLSGMHPPVISSLCDLIGGDVVDCSLALLISFFLLSAMLFAIGKSSPAELFNRHSRLFWGVTYIGVAYPVVFLVGNGVDQYHGGDSLLFLFGLLWVGDTAAMGIGSWLGKHKLAPTVSPNKTVEGFIGGIVGALAIGVLMYFWKFDYFGLWHTLGLAAGCSICGQLGDLVESMWKRSIGIKDSSAIIPGHGGVLDRFDSLLFAAPFMYSYLKLVAP
ncbi:MAG: phosphatidate cytidylyltransferase [candidate division Zixibacteria bacterium]|nr:phosphatidate cytidylyltransferase [candidate division Zixibacteria bacterium]